MSKADGTTMASTACYMSTRADLAGRAMQGILANPSLVGVERSAMNMEFPLIPSDEKVLTGVARMAVASADALLEALEEESEGNGLTKQERDFVDR